MKLTKIFWNQQKKFRIEENISESRKIFQNQEKYFKIRKNVSELRNILLNKLRKNLEFNDF